MRAAAARLDEILSGYRRLVQLGGRAVLHPAGILLLPAGILDRDRIRTMVASQPSAQLLNDRIDGAYRNRSRLCGTARLLRSSRRGAGSRTGARTPTLLRTTVEGLVADAEHLLAECFGPVSLIAEYDEETQLIEVAEILEGQLTATVHGEIDDVVVPGLLDTLAEKAGRIIWNGWPTSLAVTWAIQHGGPYPATTSPLHTSVGAAAVGRFLRPVTYQGVPDHLLPAALREENPFIFPAV